MHLRSLVALVGTWLMVVGPALAGDANSEKAAKQLVAQALEAEAAGDASKHASLLGEALTADPDFSLARWHRGEIRVGGQWKSVADAQIAAAADPARNEYLRRRAAANSLPGQSDLARWCRRQGFDDEARFHWATVLTQDPNNENALRALGVRWHGGRLMTADEAEAAKQAWQKFGAAAEEFKPQVARWERMLSAGDLKSRNEALAEIRALRESHVIAALERITLGTPLASNAKFERCHEVSQAFVAALEEMPEPAATGSLLRHAVLSPLKSVRESAIAALQKRPPHDYLPQLLGALAMPIESSYRVVTDSDGSVHYWHSLYREGPEANWSFEGRLSAMQHDLQGPTFIHIDDRKRNEVIDARLGSSANPAVLYEMASVASANRAHFGGAANASERRIASMNRMTATTNAIVVPVLAALTKQDFGDNPRAWWDWWTRYNEYSSDSEKPEYEQRFADSTHRYYRAPESNSYRIDPPPPPPLKRSCFAAGTLVWTKTGHQPIEALAIGDLVLAQDPGTGELAYKPVIGRTVRPASPILRLELADEAIETTLGHPMWVAGQGWRMAKELGDGAILHGVNGPVRVDAIEPLDEAEAYNLVVADFNTYFVGKNGILVHDNTPRGATTTVSPGMAAK